MRVYELAKELGVPSKDLLKVLRDGNYEAATHMAVLSGAALSYVRKKFSPQQEQSKIETTSSSPLQKKASMQSAKSIELSKNKPLSESIIQTKPLLEGPESKVAVVPEIIERFEDFEAREIQEQERIKSLLKTTGYAGFVPGQPSGQRRRRRRRSKAVAQQAVRVKKEAITEVAIQKDMPLFEVAELFGKQSGELILLLLKKGMVCNRNHVLSVDVIRDLAQQCGITSHVKTAQEGAVPAEFKKASAAPHGTTRWPVVVVMGHVDHGKTTLLDYVRKMNVAASEKGGITQHIRAWEVDSAHGKIVFLDTPGHEAFSYLRQRGSRITDIVVLVIAADDGIKPQTVEAIKHAKEAGVPIVVAINKVDKASPNAIETVKRQLSQYELLPEEWGGQTIIVPVSAKTGQGIDQLLEMIVLQAQMMDLKADVQTPAKAFVLESHIEKGFGPVATVVVHEGTLKQGDYFTCGTSTGKVRILINGSGKKVTQAGPSMPVQVVGFDEFAGVSDWLAVVSQSEYSKARSQKGAEVTASTPASQAIGARTFETTTKFINLIIKTDTRGSKEAVMDCVGKLIKQHKDIKCPINIVNASIGDISESDIELAQNTQSQILGLHVKIEKNAQVLAKNSDVKVQLYQIIYEMVDHVEKLLLSKKEVVMKWNKVGEAVVKKVFDIKGTGVIAGCYMRDGVLARGNKVVCMRNGKEQGSGKVITLQRDRKVVKEVHAGYECGFTSDGFSGWQEDDTVVCYNEIKVE